MAKKLTEKEKALYPSIDLADDFFGAVLNCAVRYAIGRQSYMPSLVIDFITPLIPHLNDKTLWCFDQDVAEAEYTGGYGDPNIDAPYWRKFHEAVRAERTKRGHELYKTWRTPPLQQGGRAMKDDLEFLRGLSQCDDKEQMIRYIQEHESKAKPATNADRIRAMTDEELATFLADDDRVCPPVKQNCSRHVHDCVGCHLAWLRMPAKEEANGPYEV